MSGDKPVKLAILWHMHQPNYQESNSSKLVMPWVRLHAIKDYLDMPLIAARYDKVKVNFNLVPCLIDQIELYLNGGSDPHLDLSRIKAVDLNESQQLEILNTFFSGYPHTMIETYPRFNELYKKAKDNYNQELLPSLFSSEEIRDIQVWSNLVWVDPLFRNEEPVKSLFKKKNNFTEEEKHQLLDWQLNLLKRIIPTYKQLFEQKKIDISFTPYYHPILPLLCDTNIAREAVEGIKLPKERFIHPEDAKRQIMMSVEKFQELFGSRMRGMWPSEGSVSEEAAKIIMENGIEWIATDEEILFHSLKKSKMQSEHHHHYNIYEFGPGLKIFFRDHNLSDRIGFVYSGMNHDEAVDNFTNRLLGIRKSFINQIDDIVISVILDGENAWEYFPNDGFEFLKKFYQRLNDEPLIEMVTMTEAAESVKSKNIKSLFAGSWINHNFRIWIGHNEDNLAWDLLAQTRNTLAEFEKENPDYDKQKIDTSWRQIYIAEGSDWCWWYGDEHRGKYNEQFDNIFRKHLTAVYENLQLEIPLELLKPIFHSEIIREVITPDDIITPHIDGRITHYYEWAGAGFYDTLQDGGAMHRVDKIISKIYFAFDFDYIYIRLDFYNKKSVKLIRESKCRIKLFTTELKHLEIDFSKEKEAGNKNENYFWSLDEIMEIAIKRSYIFEKEYGSMSMMITLLEGNSVVENCPENEPIRFDIPEKGKEMFWSS